MEFERASGVILHPTSFPGPYGIGDLGSEAYRFVDFLQQTGQKLWQVLPLNPTGFGDSPYASFSAFAGNPLLINPDTLKEQGLLDETDLQNVPAFPADRVDYGPVIEWKFGLLRRSYEHFKNKTADDLKKDFNQFQQQNQNWLDDFALFMAAKDAHNGAVWSDWEEALALHKPEAVKEWNTKLTDEVNFYKYLQFIFFQQWHNIRNYAKSKSVKIIGDIPIFVAYDSSDVWANPDLFYLNEKGKAIVVAGVPPDYFSPTGQYWGNPLYRWDKMENNGYEWWVERFKAAFALYDYLRIDHFRGFAAFWEVPANEERTAANGKWVQGPGSKMFKAVRAKLGELPIIAEDLGVITEDVVEIRKEMGFPGMRVLQFAFGAFETDQTDPYLPHNFDHNTIVYTGTHDNDTTAGWYSAASENEKINVRRYLDVINPNVSSQEIAWKMVRLAWSSVAELSICPMQDLLGLGGEARMNFPGKAAGNWGWRYQGNVFSDDLKRLLYDITELYARYLPPRDKPLKGQGNI